MLVHFIFHHPNPNPTQFAPLHSIPLVCLLSFSSTTFHSCSCNANSGHTIHKLINATAIHTHTHGASRRFFYSLGHAKVLKLNSQTAAQMHAWGTSTLYTHNESESTNIVDVDLRVCSSARSLTCSPQYTCTQNMIRWSKSVCMCMFALERES